MWIHANILLRWPVLLIDHISLCEYCAEVTLFANFVLHHVCVHQGFVLNRPFVVTNQKLQALNVVGVKIAYKTHYLVWEFICSHSNFVAMCTTPNPFSVFVFPSRPGPYWQERSTACCWMGKSVTLVKKKNLYGWSK